MTKLDRPLDLITYDSVANQEARENGETPKVRLVRPRTLAYVAMLVLVTGMMTYGLMTRAVVEINVQRDRAPMFVTLSDGDVRNGYTFKILNMINESRTYTMRVKDLEGAQITVIGIAEEPVDEVTLTVHPDQVGTFRVFVRAPVSSLEDQFNKIEFELNVLETGEVIEYDASFAGPER